MKIHDYLKGGPVSRIEYDFNERTGKIYFQSGRGDMDRCIEAVKSLDPNAEVLFTYTAGKPETSYHLDSDGEWMYGEFHE